MSSFILKYVALTSLKAPKASSRVSTSLLESIKQFGIVSPIVCYRKQIIDGVRRYKAARELGHTAIPAIILKSKEQVAEYYQITSTQKVKVTKREAVLLKALLLDARIKANQTRN